MTRSKIDDDALLSPLGYIFEQSCDSTVMLAFDEVGPLGFYKGNEV